MIEYWVRTRALFRAAKAIGLEDLDLAGQLLPWLRSGALRARALSITNRTSHKIVAAREIPTTIWRRATPVEFALCADKLTLPENGPGAPALEAAGFLFERAGLIGVLDMNEDEAALLDGVQVHPVPDVMAIQSASAARPSQPGVKLDSERWGEFAAALAFVGNLDVAADRKSRAALYGAVSTYLEMRGRAPMDEKTVRHALDLARHWIEQGEDPDKWL